MNKKTTTTIQAVFDLSTADYKKMVLASLDAGNKPAASTILRRLITNATADELKTILSR